MLFVGFLLGVIAFNALSYSLQIDISLSDASNDYQHAIPSTRQYVSSTCHCSKKNESSPSSYAAGTFGMRNSWSLAQTPLELEFPNRTSSSTAMADASLGDNNNNTTTNNNNDDDIQDFDPQVPVAIVTKIHGRESFGSLVQSLCLLHHAYNNRVNYDVIVFHSMPIGPAQRSIYEQTVAPAKIQLVEDNPGLIEMVDEMDTVRQQHLLHRCNVSDSSQLQWSTLCLEQSSSGTTSLPIQYNWQAEFRSLHLWKQPVLAGYRYMIWMDSDAFCTKVWPQDPIATMRRNHLVLLFDNFPMGLATGSEWITKTQQAFGQKVCSISLNQGRLQAHVGSCHYARKLRQVHGFFHITDLDFYRSDAVMHWQTIMIGDTKFSRKYDDQMAVTMPAAVLAGNRSWDMRSFGLNFSVVHNFKVDGRKSEKVGSFKWYWERHGPQGFPEAYQACQIVSAG